MADASVSGASLPTSTSALEVGAAVVTPVAATPDVDEAVPTLVEP